MPKAVPRWVIPLAVACVLAGLVVAWIAWGFVGHLVAEHRSCRVWSTQSSVQLEVDGPAAPGECQSALTQGGWTDVAPDGPTGAHLVCRYELDGTTYTVRDTGLGIFGSAACQQIATSIESRQAAGVGD